MSVERMKKAGTVASVDDPHLQELLDKQACGEVMMTYCRAIDHKDEGLLRSVFHPDSYHRHGAYEGPSTSPNRKSKPGKPADYQDPYTIEREGTVEDLAMKVHREMAEKLKFAKVWGDSVHDGQSVGREHHLCDRDLVELHW